MKRILRTLRWFHTTTKGRLTVGVLILLLICHIWLTWRIHRFVDHFCQATIMGESLMDPDIVLVHDDLLEPLKSELELGYTISTRPYDAFEFDFPRCTHSAFVTTSSNNRGLRLRFDPFRNQFHVVGYWTVR
jgi:hypothetical protein